MLEARAVWRHYPTGSILHRVSSPVERLAAALAGRYRIERELGQGGMATVYLAEDLKHSRRVAVKLLRPELAASLGPDRFLREIEIAAGLQHPHILPLYDSGQVGDPPDRLLYYVMPYVEGESLRQRLQRERQLPIEEASRIATEVAGALAYAHERGVVHRDIKPENILFSGGHALVADFGIAKAVAGGAEDRRRGASGALTQVGDAVGTPEYMSPEQASGESNLDGRTDIFALGCVLYEMLAGEPPFTGYSPQAIMAKRMTGPTPRVSTLRDTVPPPLEAAINKALTRSPADRYATAAQFAQALAEGGRKEAPPTRRGVSAALLVALAFLAGAVIVLLIRRPPGRPTTGSASKAAPSTLTRHLAQVTTREEVEEWPAWSPDGKQLVFTRELGAHRKLVLLTLASGEERQLTTGTTDDIEPAWSPDGQHIAFVRSAPGARLEPGDVLGWYNEGGDVWAIDLSNGQEQKLIANAYSPAYAPDGSHLAIEASWAGPRRIWITDAAGHNPQQLTTDSSEAVVHTSPSWSPDGKRIVFRRIEKTFSDLMVEDLATKTVAWVTHDNVVDVNPAWSPTGKFIYFSSPRGGGLNAWRVPVTTAGVPTGPPEQLTTGAGNDLDLSVSPDGKRMAFSVLAINSDIWRLPVDPANGRPTGAPGSLVTTTREDSRGAWSPDGKSIAFNSDRDGDMSLWIHTLEGGGERRLTNGPGGDYQPNWSPNGQTLAFFSGRSGNVDIWTVGVADGALHQLTTDPSIETNPFYSPDGLSVAYMSDRDGRNDAWIMNADGSGQHRLTSLGITGHFMRWTADGKFLIVRAGPRSYRIPVDGGDAQEMPDIVGGAHMSFSPNQALIMDVKGHKALWVSPLRGGAPYQVFEFPEPDARIDYPVWSPDGRWVLFDRAVAKGGDIWMLEGAE